MKKTVKVIASAALLLTTMTVGISTSTANPAINSQNSSLIASESGSFNGQSAVAFAYHSSNLRVYLANTRSKSYSYQLRNSNDYVIWKGNLAAGTSYTATFSPTDGDLDSGIYTLYLQNSDGSSSIYTLAARDELE
jgi:hypothetical protein